MALGLAMLVAGGHLLVRGATGLAAALRISPLVIGLTVVAFGTSAPELAVSVRSAIAGESELALGNVVGSNIANVLLILGLSALATPLIVSSQIVRFDVPLLIIASLAVLGLGLDGSVGRLEGLLLAAALLGYTVWSIRKSRRESRAVEQEFADAFGHPRLGASRLALDGVLIVVGLVLLTLGADRLTVGAVEIASRLGISELAIGLTIVAVGTSLPELVTSVVAALRGQRDIAVGNVVGSNLFNILGVLGLSSIVASDGIAVPSTALRLDIPVMIAVAVCCLPIFWTGHRIDRWEGGVFLAYYLLYSTYLVLAATHPSATRSFGLVMLLGIIPLTAITIAISVARSRRPSGNRAR